MSKISLPPLPFLTKFFLPTVYTVATHNGAIIRWPVCNGQNKKTGGTDFERKETESLLGWKIHITVDFGIFCGTCMAVPYQSLRGGAFCLGGSGKKGTEDDGAVCHDGDVFQYGWHHFAEISVPFPDCAGHETDS